MSSIIIPEVEIEIGENLYLQIKDVSFIPADPGRIASRPEDSYEPQPAQCDWKNDNAKLMIKKFENCYSFLLQKKFKKLISEKEFPVDDSFVYEYYNDIITAVEEMKNNE